MLTLLLNCITLNIISFTRTATKAPTPVPTNTPIEAEKTTTAETEKTNTALTIVGNNGNPLILKMFFHYKYAKGTVMVITNVLQA